MFLVRLATALESNKIHYAIVGGYAVALHGAVRGTVDVDLVLNLAEKDFVGAERVFKQLGLESRLPVGGAQVFQFRKEYIENRNLIAWSFYNPQNPIETVDIIITHNAKLMKIVKIRAFDCELRVASLPDLIEMKKQSGRPQDLADIDALEKLRKSKK
ncbi:MAG: hypothetical protein ABI041_20870 [Bdellovibrionia bacterium]